MGQLSFRRASLATLVVGALALVPVQAASASLLGGGCSSPALSQPFLGGGDSGWYLPVAGQSASGVSGSGWTLKGGARVVDTALASGSTGYVVELPPGASATSPATCAPTLTTLLPLGRMDAQQAGGSPSADAGSMYVSLAGSSVLGVPLPIVGSQGWTITSPVSLLPLGLLGSENVDFTVTSNLKVGNLEVYNLWVDPRMF